MYIENLVVIYLLLKRLNFVDIKKYNFKVKQNNIQKKKEQRK